jgi:Na+-translocating ferredoxin:NAD+ oxidoreductase RnfE subunit
MTVIDYSSWIIYDRMGWFFPFEVKTCTVFWRASGWLGKKKIDKALIPVK